MIARFVRHKQDGKYNKRVFVEIEGKVIDIIVPISENAEEFEVREVGGIYIYAGNVKSERPEYTGKGYGSSAGKERVSKPRKEQKFQSEQEKINYDHFSDLVREVSSKRNDKVIDKIKKLLALSKSPVPAEAALALDKANQLIKQEGLSLKDLDTNFGCVSLDKKEGVLDRSWDSLLISLSRSYGLIVNRDVDYQGLQSPGKIFFAGNAFFAEVAGEQFKYLYNTVLRMAQERGFRGKRETEHFVQGAVTAIAKKINELGKEGAWVDNPALEYQNALVVAQQRNLPVPRVRHTYNHSAPSVAKLEGLKAGQQVSLNRQATGGASSAGHWWKLGCI